MHREIDLRMQGIIQMMTVTQPGQRIKQRFLQQRAAQTLVCQRQTQRFGHQLQIGTRRGGSRGDIPEGEQADGFSLRNQRHAKRLMNAGVRQV